ncbi:MAG TPA: hypothetical protein VF189_05895 [Patescibacteria group bacterium]
MTKRKEAATLLRLSNQIPNQGNLYRLHRRTGYTEPKNPENPKDISWTNIEVFDHHLFELYTTNHVFYIPFIHRTYVDAEKKMSQVQVVDGQEVRKDNYYEKQCLAVASIGIGKLRLAIGTREKSTLLRNSVWEKGASMYQSDISTEHSRIDEIIEATKHVVENAQDSKLNVRKKRREERKSATMYKLYPLLKWNKRLYPKIQG